MHYHRKREWAIPERHATPEAVFFNRRAFLQGSVGAVAGSIVGMSSLAAVAEAKEQKVQDPTFDLYPAQQNPAFTLDRPLTEAKVAAKFNNFYEFDSRNKNQVWRLIDKFTIRPWTVEVTGLVHKPQTFDIDELIRTMPLEERLYRPVDVACLVKIVRLAAEIALKDGKIGTLDKHRNAHAFGMIGDDQPIQATHKLDGLAEWPGPAFRPIRSDRVKRARSSTTGWTATTGRSRPIRPRRSAGSTRGYSSSSASITTRRSAPSRKRRSGIQRRRCLPGARRSRSG